MGLIKRGTLCTIIYHFFYALKYRNDSIFMYAITVGEILSWSRYAAYLQFRSH